MNNDFVLQFHNGNSTDCYKTFGNHETCDGTSFTLWAPGAMSVYVTGDFNGWGTSGSKNGMMVEIESGIWQCCISEAKKWDKYKYRITAENGSVQFKSDPYAVCSEIRPGTASVVYEDDSYIWQDAQYMYRRKNKDYMRSPVNIYEVHLGSWRRGHIYGIDYEKDWQKVEKMKASEPFMNFRDMADELAAYLKQMNYTHVEVMPVSEHPLDGSWGYQISCFYSITSRYGTPEDFKYFVDRMHSEDIGVIIDYVPSHFCKDESGLYNFSGVRAYEYETQEMRENESWGTACFDFTKGEVISFLVSNAAYFMREYHADGLRVDAVANILYLDFGKKPSNKLRNIYGGNENIEGIEFLRKLNKSIYEEFPSPLMIAEDSSSWPLVTKPVYIGGLGFTFKWNMGWMNDTLKYMSMDPIYRKWHHHNVTFSIMYAFSENYILPISHDEVVHGKRSMIDKMYGSYEDKFNSLRCYYTYMTMHPGKKLLFMGCEIGQFIEWRYNESIEWKLLLYSHHSKLKEYVAKLNSIYLTEKALFERDDSYDGFEWIDADNSEQSVISFIRRSNDERDFIVVICNFTPVSYERYRIGVTRFADYEVLVSSSEQYADNIKKLRPEAIGWNGRPFSIETQLPSYGAIAFKPVFPQK